MRQDKKRAFVNKQYIEAIKKAVGDIKKNKTAKKRADFLKKAYSLIDKAAKMNVIHKRKANRLKAMVAKYTTRK